MRYLLPILLVLVGCSADRGGTAPSVLDHGFFLGRQYEMTVDPFLDPAFERGVTFTGSASLNLTNPNQVATYRVDSAGISLRLGIVDVHLEETTSGLYVAIDQSLTRYTLRSW